MDTIQNDFMEEGMVHKIGQLYWLRVCVIIKNNNDGNYCCNVVMMPVMTTKRWPFYKGCSHNHRLTILQQLLPLIRRIRM